MHAFLPVPPADKKRASFSSRLFGFFLSLELRFSPRSMAIVYLLLSNVVYTLISLLTKLNPEVPPSQLIYNRAFYEALLSLLTVVLLKEPVLAADEETNRLLIKRGVLGGIVVAMYFHALYCLPISICVVLFMLSPLWIAIWTSVKENRCEPSSFLFMVLSFAGMAFIIKPGFRDDEARAESGLWGFSLGCLLAVATSLLTSVVFVSIKSLKNKVHIATIVLYFNGFNLFIAGLGQIFEGVILLSPRSHLTMVGLGLLGWTGQMLRSRALMLEKVFFVSVMMYTQIAISYATDVFALGIRLDRWANLGCGLIVLAMVGMIYKGQRER